jgi:hypothetical protein
MIAATFSLIIGTALVAAAYLIASNIAERVSYRRVGGLHHWRIARVGGCFYRSRNCYHKR